MVAGTNGRIGHEGPLVGGSDGRKPVRAKGKRPAAVKAAKRASDGLRAWAYAGIGLTLGLSAWLNGLAFSGSAPWPVAGWGLGIMVPVLVLVFSRVAALLWGRGRRGLALVGGGAVLAVLGLSVQHLAASVAKLTGEGTATAFLLAVAVDVGLVVCELATVRK